MSSHLFPEISAHLLAATPTRHWLEWVDWAEAILDEPLERDDLGFAHPPALAYWWSMIFSENRYPLFGIML